MAALEATYRVVAYDHRGTHANPGELPERYTIAEMADDVVGILDNAGIARAHVMGHALGGLVALNLALRAPERLLSILLVNAWAAVDAHTRRCFDARMLLLQHAGPAAYVRAQPIFLYPAAWLARNEAAIAAEEAHGIAHFQGAPNLLRRIAALRAFDVSDRLGAVRTPTWVAAARDDVLVPYVCSERLADRIAGAQLWLTPEGGHACTVTDPNPFNAAMLSFLAGVSAEDE